MDKALLNEYINKFMPGYKEADLKKGQENRLNFLINNLTDSKSVYKNFPFKLLPISEQAKLIHFFLNLSAERQIISNVAKIDVDRNYNNFIISYEDFPNEDQTQTIFSDFQSLLNIEQLTKDMRSIIRSPIFTNKEALNTLAWINKDIINSTFQQVKIMNHLGVHCNSLEYIKSYIDYVANTLLQFLNYRVITSNLLPQKKIDILNSLSSKIEDISNMLDHSQSKHWNALVEKKINSTKILTAQNLTQYFAHYRMHSNAFSEEIKILNLLNNEIADDKATFQETEEKYKTVKFVLISDELSKTEEDIITEHQYVSNFNKKIENTRMIISIMQKYGYRNCSPNCLQDIKVYFREIFMSKTSYRNLKTLSIVRKYLNTFNENDVQPFEKTSQYMFFREKISRGYFRELGLLDLYSIKAALQKELYTCLLKCYLFYDFMESMEYIHEIANTTLKTINKSMN